MLPTSAAVCAGQTDPANEEGATDGEEPAHVSLSDQKMMAVVEQILRAEFSGVKDPKRVEIYDAEEEKGGYSDLKEAWLPKLPGVRFVLVTAGELKRRSGSGKPVNVQFFTKPKVKEGRYEIGFGNGDPFCTYSGSDWTFNMIGRVRVLRSNTGFGGVCCRGGGTGH